MSNFQNPKVPPTGGSHLPHAHPSSFEMRQTVPVPTPRGVGDGRQSGDKTKWGVFVDALDGPMQEQPRTYKRTQTLVAAVLRQFWS
jgi:hypothetical protein